MDQSSSRESNSKERNVYLYVETTSEEAISLVESLARIELAKELLRDVCFLSAGITWNDRAKAIYETEELERTIRSRIRSEVLQPDPVRVSKHLAERIRNEIKKENGDSRL